LKAVAFSLLILWCQAIADTPISMAIGDWSPYVSQHDPMAKIIEHIVTEAFKIEGKSVEYNYFPWRRSYEFVKQGRYDGTFPWNRTPDREKDFYFHKVPLLTDRGVFFHLKRTSFEWETIEDLKNYRVGVVIGFKQQELYKKLGIKADVIENEEAAFKMLLNGRIDVYQTSEVVGNYMIKKLFSEADARTITYHPKSIETNSYYVLFSKISSRSEELSKVLDSGLEKIIASGLYQSILNNAHID